MPCDWQPIFVSMDHGLRAGDSLRQVVRLPTNIKQVHAIKLLGVYVHGHYQVDPFSPNPAVYTDYVVLDLKEARTNNDDLLSNVDGCNGYFFVIPPAIGAHPEAKMLWSDDGLSCSRFSARNMPTLTFELKDMNNHVLHSASADGSLSRTGLWLSILAECA